MISIIFETHATTTDNEQSLASGWNDVALSEKGINEAKELGKRRSLSDFDAVFASDMERAFQTVTLAFEIEPRKLHIDWRLRECDYGDFSGRPKEEVDKEKIKRISEPFPNGESYNQTLERMKSFVEDLLAYFDNKRILIIGHRATHYALDRWINSTPIEQSLKTHFEWQPGWEYQFNKIRA